MKHWATILDIIDSGLENDPEKVRAYTELLLEKLADDPEEARFVEYVRRLLAGENKRIALTPCNVDIENPGVQQLLLTLNEQRQQEEQETIAFYKLLAEAQ